MMMMNCSLSTKQQKRPTASGCHLQVFGSQFLSACFFVIILVLLESLQSGVAFPSGAPEKACKDLKPGHGHEPQSGSAPFELSQDKAEVSSGEQVKVTLSSPSKTTFKGLIVQAVNEKNEPVGKFLAGKGLKLLDSCSAVTHSDREAKKTATLVWEAPADWKSKTRVTFRGSVVQKFDTIYTNLKSSSS